MNDMNSVVSLLTYEHLIVLHRMSKCWPIQLCVYKWWVLWCCYLAMIMLLLFTDDYVCSKTLLDENVREVRLLQEMYLPDGDLTGGRGRTRRFRWKNVGQYNTNEFVEYNTKRILL